MTQLTLRGFDRRLANCIRELARREGISLNQAALRLLKKGAGLDEGAPREERCVGSSMDDLIGTWSEEEAKAFNRAVEVFEQIDEEMWQ